MIDYIVPPHDAGRQEGNRIAYETCPMKARSRVVGPWIVVAPYRSPEGAAWKCRMLEILGRLVSISPPRANRIRIPIGSLMSHPQFTLFAEQEMSTFPGDIDHMNS